jgi:predicted phosphodiesterase
MLIGLLSDAHGNPVGLRACLAVLASQGVDRLFFLGDAVGYLPGEQEVLRLLAEAGAECQQGNHEAMLLGDLPLDPVKDEAYGLAAARTRLTGAERARIAGWPRARSLDLDGRRVLLVHGSPRQPLTDYIYPDADLGRFDDLPFDAVFMGNTHRPFVAYRGDRLIANVGSCGLPRDQGDLPTCAVYDTVAHECRVLRVPVPAEEVLAQFTAGVVHPIVSSSLHRKASTPFGSVVPRT